MKRNKDSEQSPWWLQIRISWVLAWPCLCPSWHPLTTERDRHISSSSLWLDVPVPVCPSATMPALCPSLRTTSTLPPSALHQRTTNQKWMLDLDLLFQINTNNAVNSSNDSNSDSNCRPSEIKNEQEICSESTNLRRSRGSGFRTLDFRIRSVIRIATKIVPLGPWAMPYPSKKFRQNPFTSLRVIRRTDRQTDRQTDRTKNITSFFGGGNYCGSWCKPVVNPMQCLSVCLSVSPDGVLWKNDWVDADAVWGDDCRVGRGMGVLDGWRSSKGSFGSKCGASHCKFVTVLPKLLWDFLFKFFSIKFSWRLKPSRTLISEISWGSRLWTRGLSLDRRLWRRGCPSLPVYTPGAKNAIILRHYQIPFGLHSLGAFSQRRIPCAVRVLRRSPYTALQLVHEIAPLAVGLPYVSYVAVVLPHSWRCERLLLLMSCVAGIVNKYGVPVSYYFADSSWTWILRGR